MKSFPIFLILKNQPCLVVGGGDVAARKVNLLLRSDGIVTVLAPLLCNQLTELANTGKIKHKKKTFEKRDIDNSFLVIAATDDDETNRQIATTAHEEKIPVNVVDEPKLCTFIFPSIVDRSPVTIAVSTGGASPVLARLLRARLETLIPTAYGKLAALVDRYRQQVKLRFPNVDERRYFWESVLQGPITEMLFSGKEKAADEALRDAVVSARLDSKQGEVYLVGAGPGDPDLLTFRALRLMQQADVVLYDRLVSKEILDLTRRDAEKIYVGKERAKHTVPQPKINEQLAALAKQGKRVLRLKGGDPFIFGRGGEEIGELTREGISFQVVPGISAASGCASYSGIPLTHRDYAQSCIFVTGHLKDGSIDLNWDALAQPKQTVVIYMGLIGLPVICRELIAHGVDAGMPIALIEKGTTKKQRVFTGSLSTLPGIIEK
ncbi:MAG: siroheme synthase CysG, partial [Arenicellales bacterium]|nr:siroheme synthase CysG [Arenicellales bacterium]